MSRSLSILLAVAVLIAFFATGVFYIRKNDRAKTPTDSPASQEQAGSEKQMLSEAGSGIAQSLRDEARRADSAQKSNGEKAPPSFFLEDFHRSEVRDGEKVWELKAAQGRYIPETQQAEVIDALLWVYKNDGSTTALEAGKARLQLEQSSLLRAKASKGVKVIYNDDVVITSKTAVYDNEKGTIRSPGNTFIEHEAIDIQGEDLHIDIESKVATLRNNVNSVIKPKSRQNDT